MTTVLLIWSLCARAEEPAAPAAEPAAPAAEPAAPAAPPPAPGARLGEPVGELGQQGASSRRAQGEREAKAASRGRRASPAAGEPASNDLWFAAAVVGALCLLGVVYFWFRGRQRTLRLPEGVRRIPDAGLFGAGTPGLAPGLSQWVVADEDRDKLLDRLVTEIGGLRPVFLLAEDSAAVSSGRVGPLYRAAFDKPAEFHDAAYDLQDAHPSLALVLGLPAARGPVAEWAREVHADFPVLAIVAQAVPGEGAVVRCTLTDAGWSFAGEPAPA